jgi:hypothetical protein
MGPSPRLRWRLWNLYTVADEKGRSVRLVLATQPREVDRVREVV